MLLSRAAQSGARCVPQPRQRSSGWTRRRRPRSSHSPAIPADWASGHVRRRGPKLERDLAGIGTHSPGRRGRCADGDRNWRPCRDWNAQSCNPGRQGVGHVTDRPGGAFQLTFRRRLTPEGHSDRAQRESCEMPGRPSRGCGEAGAPWRSATRRRRRRRRGPTWRTPTRPRTRSTSSACLCAGRRTRSRRSASHATTPTSCRRTWTRTGPTRRGAFRTRRGAWSSSTS